MKIHFSNVNFSSNTGPNSFGHRLADQFEKLGHEIVLDYKRPHDVFLAFIEAASNPYPRAKTVLRLDGIWFKPNDFEKNNRSIKQCYMNFDKVIWQSDFDRQMIEKWFGKRDGHVIHNGIELKSYKPYQLPQNFSKEGPFPENHIYFICSSNWHGQKRLPDNIRLFKRIRKFLRSKNIDSTLLVLGNYDNNVAKEVIKVWTKGSPERIAWIGNASHQECLELYSAVAKSGGYMIHLAFADHSPNVLCEALSQRCPVIYASDGGGCKELVLKSGIEVPSTKKYNFELVDYDNPPPIDINKFKIPKNQVFVKNEHVNIELIARRYLGVMR